MKSYLRKHKLLFVCWGFCLLLMILSIIMLNTTTTHRELGKYTQAICKKCGYKFEDSTCKKCGNNIIEYGIFKDRSEQYVYDLDTTVTRVPFKNYFSSFTEYYKDYQFATYWSGFFIGCLIAFPVIFIMYKIKMRKRKNKDAE